MDKITSGWRLFLAAGALAASSPAASQDTQASEQPPAPPAAPAPAPAPAPTPAPAPAASSSQVVQDPPTPLPALPAAPQAPIPAYPDCRESHASTVGRVAKATRVHACLVRLNQYDRDILQVYARRMLAHREEVIALWNQVNRSDAFSAEQKVEFHGRILVEARNSHIEGPYMDEYRLVQGRYRSDNEFLRTEYCNLVNCRRAQP